MPFRIPAPVSLRILLRMAALCLLAPALANAEALAITFDDLPLNGELATGQTRVGITRDVLTILQKYRVPQTFGFVNAAKAVKNPDGQQALEVWMAGGQRVGNHTWSHPDLTRIDVGAFTQNILRNEAMLRALSPHRDWHWFRYPYLHEGETLEKRHQVRAVLRERGYRIAQVTVDWEDYAWNFTYAKCGPRLDAKSKEWLRTSYLKAAAEYIDADRAMAQTIFGREISHVLLLHVGAYSSTILPHLFELLRQKGFTLVTLEQAQQDAIYESDPDGGLPGGGSLLEQWLAVRELPYPKVAPKPFKELEALCK